MTAPTEVGAAPYAKGDWVAEAPENSRPSIAKVRDCYWDEFSKEWVADMILYSPDGDRIGRESPACGGPRSFEPCVPVADWRKIERPDFPLSLDRTGYRGWASNLVYTGAQP